jgi:uncharacterized cupin superfamily protein
LKTAIVMTTAADVDLGTDAQSFPSKWVLDGAPESKSKILARSSDSTANVEVWECTAGSFRWHYDRDEVVVVISGEAFLIHENGRERRFAAGDVGFFPAGTDCTWRVDDHFRKVAVLKESLWGPFGIALKGWSKISRVAAGFASSLKPAFRPRLPRPTAVLVNPLRRIPEDT